ncbi:MAG: dethiobiotin synthase [Candidatus Omnitrophica bacterium]|nr:dethiobiotin synthase [Candidatus Omnitrophota bacterium]
MVKTIDQNIMFICATDTDAGKTVVTSGLLRKAVSQGINAIAIKPVQTGLAELDADVLMYKKAVPEKYPDDILKRSMIYGFDKPCSPHLAAESEDKYVEIKYIIEQITAFTAKYDLVLVEGSGGLLVPLNENELFLDLLKKIGAPVILVADNKLGAINHSLLSLAELKRHHINVNAMIFNNTCLSDSSKDYIRQDNKITVAKYGQVVIAAEIENLGKNDFWDNIDHQLSHIKFEKYKNKWKII